MAQRILCLRTILNGTAFTRFTGNSFLKADREEITLHGLLSS